MMQIPMAHTWFVWLLRAQFDIVRVKHTYHSTAHDLVGGYCDMKVFIMAPLASQTIQAQMVCEVKLLLRSFLHVKKQMHLLHTSHGQGHLWHDPMHSPAASDPRE